MSDHVHSTACDGHRGSPCYSRGQRCGVPHQAVIADDRQVTCGRLDGHIGEHGGFGPGMRRVRWSA